MRGGRLSSHPHPGRARARRANLPNVCQRADGPARQPAGGISALLSRRRGAERRRPQGVAKSRLRNPSGRLHLRLPPLRLPALPGECPAALPPQPRTRRKNRVPAPHWRGSGRHDPGVEFTCGAGASRSVWSARSLLPLWTALVSESGSKLRALQTLSGDSKLGCLPDTSGEPGAPEDSEVALQVVGCCAARAPSPYYARINSLSATD